MGYVATRGDVENCHCGGAGSGSGGRGEERAGKEGGRGHLVHCSSAEWTFCDSVAVIGGEREGGRPVSDGDGGGQ